MNADIIIIGGGAAGLIAGIFASQSGLKVIILEKMPRAGRKIMITGKGRCNLTNVKDWENFSGHIRTNPKFLRPAFFNFTPENVLELMKENGLETVVERGDRAYPKSMKSSDVVDTLVGACRKNGVQILFNQCVSKVIKQDGSFEIHTKENKKYSCRSLIIATGGLAYPGTGSTGDGYSFAKELNHTITPLFPSLTALVPKGYKKNIKYSDLKCHIPRNSELSDSGKLFCGTSLKNIGVKLYSGQTLIRDEFGDIDFTDGGLEGPIGFAISRDAVKILTNGGKVKITLDFKPSAKPENLIKRINDIILEADKDKRYSTLHLSKKHDIILQKLLPRDFIPAFCHLNEKVISDFKKNIRNFPSTLAEALKCTTLQIEGFVGYERCVITAGGINLSEIVSKTMESKLHENLFFCGEILDLDCDTGGYNMHTAFCTGALAGINAGKRLNDSGT